MHTRQARGAALVVARDDLADGEDPAPAAVLGAHAELRAVVRGVPGAVPVQWLQGAGDVVGMDEGRPEGAVLREFPGLVAEHPPPSLVVPSLAGERHPVP